MSTNSQTNRLLGYPDDARLLIINADHPEIPFGVHLTDYDFLTSQQVKDVVREDGIILLDYRALQEVWSEKKVYRKKR